MGSSDSDSESRKQRKKEKKPKKDKKHKKHKKNKKRKHESASENEETPVVDVQKFYKTAMVASVVSLNNESFGPALPPHLLNKNVITVSAPPPQPAEDADENDLDVLGPTPGPSRTQAQIELEQRALEMKLGKLSEDTSKNSATVREEWMLELPDVGLKGGLDSLKRVFKTKEGPDFSDRSDWTTVAGEDDEFHKFEKKKRKEQDSRSEAEIRAEKDRDEEQEQMAKKLRKDDEKSLLQIHQEKLDEKRRLKGKEPKADRRRFDRDVDLQLNKIDKSHTKKIVDGTKFLDSKFGAGRAKYL